MRYNVEKLVDEIKKLKESGRKRELNVALEFKIVVAVGVVLILMALMLAFFKKRRCRDLLCFGNPLVWKHDKGFHGMLYKNVVLASMTCVRFMYEHLCGDTANLMTYVWFMYEIMLSFVEQFLAHFLIMNNYWHIL